MTESISPKGLDLETISSLQEIGRLRDKDNYLGSLVSMFAEHGNGSIADITSAFNSQEKERLRRAAHRLKGMSKSIGAAKLADICLEIEKTGGSSTLVADLDKTFAKSCLMLKTIAEDDNA